MKEKFVERKRRIYDMYVSLRIEEMSLLEDILRDEGGRVDLPEEDIENGEYPVSVYVDLRTGLTEIRITSVRIDGYGHIYFSGIDDCGDLIEDINTYGDYKSDLLDFVCDVA